MTHIGFFLLFLTLLHGITSYSSVVAAKVSVEGLVEGLVSVALDKDASGVNGSVEAVASVVAAGLNTELIVFDADEAPSSIAFVIPEKASAIEGVDDEGTDEGTDEAGALATFAALIALARELDSVLIIILYIYILVFSKVYIMSNPAINDASVIANGNSKSDYTMYYKTEFVNAIHNIDNISISYSINQNSKSAMYNNTIYNVVSLMIVYPAVHSFNGNANIPGEVIIKHTNGSKNLNVCIPINTVPTNNINGSNIIANIVNAISTEAPTVGNSAQGITEFSIMNIIPKSPYYIYTASNGDTNIVFGLNSAIYLVNSNMNKFKSMFDKYSTTAFKYNSDLYKSINNPINGLIGNEIYIDCSPTSYGKEEEILVNKHTGQISAPPIFFTRDMIAILIQILTALALILILIFIAIVYKYGNDAVVYTASYVN